MLYFDRAFLWETAPMNKVQDRNLTFDGQSLTPGLPVREISELGTVVATHASFNGVRRYIGLDSSLRSSITDGRVHNAMTVPKHIEENAGSDRVVMCMMPISRVRCAKQKDAMVIFLPGCTSIMWISGSYNTLITGEEGPLLLLYPGLSLAVTFGANQHRLEYNGPTEGVTITHSDLPSTADLESTVVSN